MVTLAETVIAVWLGFGAVFAIYGMATEDHSEFNLFRKLVLLISVILLWPLTFLPSWQHD